MGIIERAKADWKKFSQEVELTFTNGTETAVIMGLGTRHAVSMDTDGIPVNMPNNHVSFHEELFNEANANYIIRPNGGEEIDMSGSRVSFADSTGTSREHIVKTAWADQTVGMIVCELENEEDGY